MMRLIVFSAVGLVVCNVGKSQTCNLAVALAMTAAGGQVVKNGGAYHILAWRTAMPSRGNCRE